MNRQSRMISLKRRSQSTDQKKVREHTKHGDVWGKT